jgi:hypothetical protein
MVRFKECFKCKAVKLLEDFYKHPAMGDGHVNKCKECNKNDVTAHRNKNIEKIREYDRQRGKNPERIKAATEINRIWRAQDKRRGFAHSSVQNAIKSGKLIRLPCCKCNNEKTVAHHEDYDKPLEVIWFCHPCHKQ